MAEGGRISRFRVPALGTGIGFRVPHYRAVIEDLPAIDWFEVISENFMLDGGSPLWFLDQLRERYPVVLHGVSADLGGPGDPEHAERLERLVRRVNPPWVSDHACTTGGVNDLLPLPWTEEVLRHMVARVRGLQDRLERPFAVENVSSYARWGRSEMPEWEFMARLADEADCALLLDVNNVYVSAKNHGFDPITFLDAMPVDRVVQLHVAGHTVLEHYRIDTHDREVCEDVRALLERTRARLGAVSLLLERDEHIPELPTLVAEARSLP